MKYGLVRSKRQLVTDLGQRLYRHWLGLTLLGLGLAGMVGLTQLVSLPLSNLGMGWQGGLTMAVTLAVFLLNALTSLAAEVVFLGGLAVLYVFGILTTDAALAGFSNPGMVDRKSVV